MMNTHTNPKTEMPYRIHVDGVYFCTTYAENADKAIDIAAGFLQKFQRPFTDIKAGVANSMSD